MKQSILTIFFLSIFLISINVLLTSSSGGRAFAANSGNTGAPNEPTTCRSCHGTGFGITVAITIKDTSGTVVTSYTPGDTLSVDFEVKTTTGSPSRYGFQMVTLDSADAAYNNWVAPSSNTRIVSVRGRSYAEHRGASTTKTFSSDWVAPKKGSGDITFYGGGAAVNNNRGTSGDGGAVTSLTITENVSTGLRSIRNDLNLKVFPNPVQDFLTIDFGNVDVNNGILSIRSIDGRLISEELISTKATTRKITTNNLESGIYTISINDGKSQFYRTKFIKR